MVPCQLVRADSCVPGHDRRSYMYYLARASAKVDITELQWSYSVFDAYPGHQIIRLYSAPR